MNVITGWINNEKPIDIYDYIYEDEHSQVEIENNESNKVPSSWLCHRMALIYSQRNSADCSDA